MDQDKLQQVSDALDRLKGLVGELKENLYKYNKDLKKCVEKTDEIIKNV